jgi:hypothetical protein
MTMDLFANRLHEVHFVNGIVRLEFCIAGRDESGEFSPDAPVKPEDVRFTVNLPLRGYGRSIGILRKFTQELQEKGVLRKPEEGAQEVQDTRARARSRQASLVDITSEVPEDDGSSEQGGPPLV